jgi:hypothetical protein
METETVYRHPTFVPPPKLSFRQKVRQNFVVRAFYNVFSPVFKFIYEILHFLHFVYEIVVELKGFLFFLAIIGTCCYGFNHRVAQEHNQICARFALPNATEWSFAVFPLETIHIQPRLVYGGASFDVFVNPQIHMTIECDCTANGACRLTSNH